MSGAETSFDALGYSLDGCVLKPSEPTKCVEVDKKDTDSIRQEYLQTIKQPNWQQLMISKAKSLCGTLETQGWTFTDDCKLSLSVRGKLCELSNPINIIGRNLKCDISVKNPYVSRVHAVIITCNNPDGHQYIIVIDFWSLMGTTIKAPDSPDSTSDSKHRSLLLLRSVPGAKIQIDCNGTKIDLNFYARECIVCYERPREVRFGCGHSVSCNQCALQLNACPICREFILTLNQSMGFNTNVT